MVMKEKTLAALASARPRTPDDLLALPGIGPRFVERFGTQILDLVAATQPAQPG